MVIPLSSLQAPTFFLKYKAKTMLPHCLFLLACQVQWCHSSTDAALHCALFYPLHSLTAHHTIDIKQQILNTLLKCLDRKSTLVKQNIQCNKLSSGTHLNFTSPKIMEFCNSLWLGKMWKSTWYRKTGNLKITLSSLVSTDSILSYTFKDTLMFNVVKRIIFGDKLIDIFYPDRRK